MTIRFAAARKGDTAAALARALTVPHLREAANDNTAGLTRDALLKAALRHFAQYGLAAAERARENAELAFFAGDREQYQHWLEICRALDRRLAARVSRHIPHRRGAPGRP